MFRFFLRIVATFLLLCCLAGMTGWAVLALYFGDSAVSLLRTVLAAVFAFVGLITLLAIFVGRWRVRALTV